MKKLYIVLAVLTALCCILLVFRLITGRWNVFALFHSGYDVFIDEVSISDDEIVCVPGIPNSSVGIYKYKYEYKDNDLYIDVSMKLAPNGLLYEIRIPYGSDHPLPSSIYIRDRNNRDYARLDPSKWEAAKQRYFDKENRAEP